MKLIGEDSFEDNFAAFILAMRKGFCGGEVGVADRLEEC